MTAADLAPDEHAYVAPEGTAVPPLAIAHPAIAEWAAMSPARQTLMRADMLVRKLDEAGIEVTYLTASDTGSIAIQVAPGMVAAAAFELGITARSEFDGAEGEAFEMFSRWDPHTTVYGAVSAR